jgi:integrase
MCELLSACLAQWRRQSAYSTDEDFVFASPKLNGLQPLWGQTLNCNFVKPAAIALGVIAEGERFGWHCFRHSLSTWADEAVSDLSVPQMLLRQSDPKMTEAYIHRRFEIGLEAQHRFMQQLLGARSVEQLLGELRDRSGWR